MYAHEKYLPRIKRHLPDYRFSWEILTELILEQVTRKPNWLDVGAGDNILIAEQPGAEFAMGIGIQSPPDDLLLHRSFCAGDVCALPIKCGKFDFVTARYLFEHLARPEKALEEIAQVLRPGGLFIMQTTNRLGPLILLGRMIPFAIKRRLIKIIFDKDEKSTFRTYHKFNSLKTISRYSSHLMVEKIIMVDDVLYQKRPLFSFSFFISRLLELFGLHNLKNNIIVIFRKKAS